MTLSLKKRKVRELITVGIRAKLLKKQRVNTKIYTGTCLITTLRFHDKLVAQL